MEAHGFFLLLCCAAALLPAGAQRGFISIDCGLTETDKYVNPLDNLTYVSDDGFIDSGVNVQIDPARLPDGTNKVYYTVRSFPNYRRNCYQLPATVGSKYVVRASFLYANYDGLSTIPSFDLYLGVDLCDTVKLTTGNTEPLLTELIVQAKASYLYVCLVNTGQGTPFISSLKLRPLSQDMYAPANSSASLALKTFSRMDLGTNKYTKFPDDRFDRIWTPNFNGYGIPYSTEKTVAESGSPIFGMPSVVMQTAVYSTDEILVNWTGGVDDMFYLYLEFADVVQPADGQSRQMNVYWNGAYWSDVSVSYLDSNVLYSSSHLTASRYSFSIRSANESDKMGAVLNSFEVYNGLIFNGSATDARDVSALQKIKEFYNLKKNWIGDPCLPVSPWDGLICDNGSTPRILTLDLSSSELNGAIAPQISELTALKTLNLSRNNLKGPVPAFLQNLQTLIDIDLSSNDLSGSIPPGLQEKNKTGEIVLSIDHNPRICQEYHCGQDGKGRKKLIVISVVVSLVAAIVILLLVVTAIKRRKQNKLGEGRTPKNNKEMVDSLSRQRGSFGSIKSGTFTYSDVVEMTNNFETVIGRGGSGSVFYGRLKDGREVAVKKLSSSLGQRGTKEFAAEVKMLIQVNHKHLTPLVGYCDDEKEMILIYEYMSKGNLQKLLSDKTADALNWRQRLNIALEAAKGLEYLHSGCTTTFIHRDVKSSNILVNENFEAKVADFGLSKAVVSDEITHITTAVAGTAGYLDPEYCYTNKVTEKSDVYSFGVVLFELITGRSAMSTNVKGERVPLVQLVWPELIRGDIKSIVDPRLQGQYDINSIRIVAETAMACAAEKSVIRPTMTQVVAQLNEAMEIERARERSGSWRMWATPTSSSFGKTSLSANAASDAPVPIYPSAR